MKHFIFFLLSTSLTLNAQIRTASTTVGSSNDMDLEVTINDFTGVTSFEVTGPSSKWFAAAFNTTSMNGYAIVHNNNGGNPDEYTMNGNGAPTIQTTQNLQSITSSTSGTEKTFNYTRLNSTGNTNDYTFTTSSSTLNIAYAIGSGANLAYHGPNRGSASLTFTNPCDPSVFDTLTVISICENETASVFGNLVGGGTYNDTTWSIIGCDSLIQVQVVEQDTFGITPLDTTVCLGNEFIFGSIDTLFSAEGSYTIQDTNDCNVDVYNIEVVDNETQVFVHSDGVTLEYSVNGVIQDAYWYMCDLDSIIPPPVLPTLLPTIPGDYAFVNHAGGCADTSDCITITAEDLGIVDIDQLNFDFVVNNKIITIINSNLSDYDVVIYNAIGQVVVTEKSPNTMDLNTFADGIYVMKVNSGKAIKEYKVLIH